MRPYIVVFIVAFFAGLGCRSGTESPVTEEAVFVTSFDAIRLVVQPLAGDLPVHTLLPPGTSPHAYSPRPSEAHRMQQSALVIHAHADIDGWVGDLAPGNSYALFAAEDATTYHDAGAGSPFDPESNRDALRRADPEHRDAHYWTDPVAISRSLQPLATRLCAVRPQECTGFRRRAIILRAQVDSLHHRFEQAALQRKSACIISSEPFADRMLERYAIPHVGPLRLSADVPPTPARMTRVIEEARQSGCRSLLVQSAFENRLEKRLADEQGWDILEVDPLGAAAPDLVAYLSGLFDALTLPSPSAAP
ncbi:MAG: metal ABC transporter substrate-binding protein [Bacteroidetes bacterium]|nr:metal ABC transporter substrate-binding protein [Bacteroidota bacterium]MDA0874189.1 metal ABC transporter substrate-binding protein [Bacteroidota bacterium]